MKGVDVKLPMNLQGVILRENEKLGLERELKFGGKFDEFTYWNYDKIPSENDAYRKALHWIKISEAVMSCIMLINFIYDFCAFCLFLGSYRS